MVTIKDVAKLAGVSTATVSRALAEPDKVAPRTRKRVEKAIKKTGYTTNSLASNFRRRRTRTLVVLVPDIANPFFSSIIQGIEDVALRQGYRILLGDTQQDREREKAYSALVSQRQADGIICLGMNIPFEYDHRRKSVDPAWPPFAMACEYDGVIPVPTVAIDNRAAAREAVDHLLELGHRDIAVINGPADSPLCRDRKEGFRDALDSAGIMSGSRPVVSGDFSLASGYQAARKLLARNKPPSALFCANDEMAIGAMKAAREQGFDIPHHLSVVGFDDISFASYCYPPLTTVYQPRSLIGERVMQVMLDILNGNPPSQSRIILPHELVLRESTAPPAPSAVS